MATVTDKRALSIDMRTTIPALWKKAAGILRNQPRILSGEHPILTIDERLEILRRTAGSIAPLRAKKMLAHVAALRKESDRKIDWPKRSLKK